MNKLVIGILAHVDAGKTTLSESMLYLSGKIGTLGRVDKKNAYLDNYELEKARGITIFSKQALFEVGKTQITLLDTPGHVDFSAEMERTLQVLDYAILVISGADGVQGHTRTLWRLLHKYRIPVFIFVNKMDQYGADRDKLLEEIKGQLNDNCIDFGQEKTEEFYEQLALCDEALMETYLETGMIETESIRKVIKQRKAFPCYFGSALKLEGIDAFMRGIINYGKSPSYPNQFGAKVFKITRDDQGNRLTHIKVTGGYLKVRDIITNGDWEEKVNQIRIYSGQKYEAIAQVQGGTICAVTGLTMTRAGQGLGIESHSEKPLLEPVLSYQMLLPEGVDPRAVLPKLRELEEEDPELKIIWDEGLQEIQVQIMGEVQIEILQSLIKDRFNVAVAFDDGKIVYKETIRDVVEGVGHFEPLRHYAEVHLLLEPGAQGSGLQYYTSCSEDLLGKSWQRLVLSHLKEKEHVGVLTGSAITDMKITLVSGKAHNKHTEGGDFREATYRAVRQGLKEAQSILLEPYYEFHLEVPQEMVGRAMNDIEKMHGISQIIQTDGELSTLIGSAPVITMRNYQKEVASYSKGLGRLSCQLKGYEPCHNGEEVIEAMGYDSERDPRNPTGSVFCSHGSGFLVPWNEVKEYMHVESYLQKEEDTLEETPINQKEEAVYSEDHWISLEEIDRIMNKTFYANQGAKSDWKRSKPAKESYYKPVNYSKKQETKEEYLLVDGYNIIYAWPELKALAEDNMDGARMKLLDILSNYQGIKKCHIIVVFDAYRVQGHREEVIDYHNIHMVFTKEAQTADEYIEKFAYDHTKKYKVVVATSDGLQQVIVRGAGGALLSARELKDEIEKTNDLIKEKFKEPVTEGKQIGDILSQEIKKQMEEATGSKDKK